MATILIVDDQPAIRQGLRILISTESGLAVVGEAATGSEALALAKLLQPDIIIMDVAMPDVDGITITRKLSTFAPRCAVIILTIHDDAETRLRAFDAGAHAFVVKGTAEAICSAIRNVSAPATSWSAP